MRWITHELRHAHDHIAGDTNMKGALENNDPWMHRIRSEWHAHASQARAAHQIKKRGGKIPDRDELLLKAWNAKTFSIDSRDEPQSMFSITKSYMGQYNPKLAGKAPDDVDVTKFIDNRKDWQQEAFDLFPADPKKWD